MFVENDPNACVGYGLSFHPHIYPEVKSIEGKTVTFIDGIKQMALFASPLPSKIGNDKDSFDTSMDLPLPSAHENISLDPSSQRFVSLDGWDQVMGNARTE